MRPLTTLTGGSDLRMLYFDYAEGDTHVRSTSALPARGSGNGRAVPGVLIAHDRTGEGAYVERRAPRLLRRDNQRLSVSIAIIRSR